MQRGQSLQGPKARYYPIRAPACKRPAYESGGDANGGDGPRCAARDEHGYDEPILTLFLSFFGLG